MRQIKSSPTGFLMLEGECDPLAVNAFRSRAALRGLTRKIGRNVRAGVGACGQRRCRFNAPMRLRVERDGWARANGVASFKVRNRRNTMALPQSYRELTGEVATQMRALRKTQPDLMSAFAALAAAGTKEGALGKKTRELVALGIAIASRCDDCIGFHVQTLVKLGTTRAEFEDLLATAVYMGGGPSMMYAAHALKAFEEFGGE
ncbi:carboxymuconolactone decarboxylase family protein [Burkholderia thailandensis E264]|uniref:Carboxymuconolactone decarboxylase family protein n=2 Tax=Burkholderia thailandensis TaxID=57975 RepID=Q2T186_BURTA|nr:carboxymuconolactone decarboxylase family protein [Burkholderia thailandensis E264]